MMSELGRVIELLLSGEFICEVSHEDAFEFLKQPQQLNQVENHLSLLNRKVTCAAEGSVFFAAYQQIDERERKHLNSQFQEIAANLMPMVEWLLLVQEASGTDSPLTQGSPIRLTELQSTIEDTPAFSDQLSKIAAMRLFGSSSTTVDGQLKQIFKRLTELGYLIKPNVEKAIYIATGKIDYLVEVLKFIDETEALSLAEQAEDAMSQGSLF